MRINHNIAALNTHRQLNSATTAQSKSMEKLASGLRINKAGDDAAGLAISEKMRGQIRGLDQASKNSQDGISMIATAEGALNETHDILQRMRELATQASNDTNVGVDRGEIQKEINQLSSEINRVGNTTEFNTQSLLKGDGGVQLVKTGVVADAKLATGGTTHTQATQDVDISAAAVAGDNISFTLNGETIEISFKANSVAADDDKVTDITANSASVNLKETALSNDKDTAAAAVAKALEAAINANDKLRGNFTVDAASGKITVAATSTGEFAGANGHMAATTGTLSDAATTAGLADIGTTVHDKATIDITLAAVTDATTLEGKGITIGGTALEFYDANKGAYTGSAQGINISEVTDATTLGAAIAAQAKLNGVTVTSATGTLTVTAKVGGAAGNDIEVKDGGIQKNFKANFQVGANKGQSMTIEIADMRASALGITGKAGAAGFTTGNSVTDGTNNTNKEAALDVSSHESASAAIKTINDAIETVSAQRSNLGSSQNRLEHTINNLNTSSENLTAAESRIRDVDMAKEMMEQTKNSILSQAAQAMLAQANQQPQGVLQLLR